VLQSSARLLRLLSLLQARRYWTGPELAERLEVTERTVRRDVDRLRQLGYPVEASSGVAGGYQLGAGANIPPLLLEDEEALAVAIGLRTAAGGSVAGIGEAAVRALAKLEQVLPVRLRRRVRALHSHIVPLHWASSPVDPDLLARVAAACRDHEELEFSYAGKRGPSARRVEPYGLVHTGYRWYLVAWDVDADAWRTFRVDRVEQPLKMGARYLPRPLPDADLGDYVSRSITTTPYSVQARVLLHAPIQLVSERVSKSAGTLEAVDDEHCVVSFGAHSAESLILWTTLIGFEYEVLDPPELRRHLREMAERLTRAAVRSEARASNGSALSD